MAYRGFKKLTRDELKEKYGLTDRDRYLLDELEAIEADVEAIVKKEET